MSRRPHLLSFLIIVQCSLLLSLSSMSCAQRVRIGAEILIEQHLDILRGKRIGIICNHTSVFPNGTHLVDSLLRLDVHVTALFGPEHGIRGMMAAGEGVESRIDTTSRLLVYSLYGKTKKPTAEMLKEVDVLLFDIQDVGARFYTYASTMALAMEAAAENGKKFIVLDRPNPINGIQVEGPVLDTAFKSFVGMFPIPIRHGLTLGELAKMIVGEKWLGDYSNVDLTVIPMEGWKREMWYDETNLPWISPSPNMKSLATAIVYSGTCLFEGTNVSEGRGTEHPFEYIGAPWMNGDSLAKRLNSISIPGVQFIPIHFTPTADSVAAPNPKYKGELCGGIRVNVKDRESFRPFTTSLRMLETIKRLYDDSLRFRGSAFDKLSGSMDIRRWLEKSDRTDIPEPNFDKDIQRFISLRRSYLIY